VPARTSLQRLVPWIPRHITHQWRSLSLHPKRGMRISSRWSQLLSVAQVLPHLALPAEFIRIFSLASSRPCHTNSPCNSPKTSHRRMSRTSFQPRRSSSCGRFTTLSTTSAHSMSRCTSPHTSLPIFFLNLYLSAGASTFFGLIYLLIIAVSPNLMQRCLPNSHTSSLSF
jgi:hypothetical protein